MAQIVKLRRSSVSGQKPTNTNLQLGELALNTTDGKVFMAVSGSGGPSVQELLVTNTVNTGSINLIGSISSSYVTSSFIGDGSGLYNIPVSGVTDLSTISGSLDSRLDVLEAYSSSMLVPSSSMSFRTLQTDVYCKNMSGAQINKGTVVRITGAVGDNPLIGVASLLTEGQSANTLGITTEDIPNDSFGLVITEGVLTGVNTSGMTAGQLIFLGPNGTFTTSYPVPPNHGVRLGEVLRVQQQQGSIYVRIDNGAELGESHDVLDSTTSSSYGDLLVKSGSVWINSKNLNGDYAVTGSLTITQNLTVLGSSSLVYVTSSNLAVSASFISVNVFEPAERFGGLKVYDSGSSNATASLAWDSLHNHWVYQNVSGSEYSGGMLLSGPRNTGSLGDEPGLINGRIVKSVGGDHIDVSIISETGTTITVAGDLVANSITGAFDFFGLVNRPTLVSGSSQILITGTTGYSDFSSSISASIGSLSSSIATTTNDLDSRLDSIELTTGSLNSFTSSYSTGSFTGSFIGDGSGLYNIPATGVTGLQLDRIINGNVSASLANNILEVNTDTTIYGDLIVSNSFTIGNGFSDIITIKALISSSLVPDSDAIHHYIGGPAKRWEAIYSRTGSFNHLEGITGTTITISNAVASGSFTGSYIGDGSGLYNIPASGVTGLQLDKIVSGNASASIDNNGFYVNKNVYIDGTITAKELYIDYVTSSVLYESGSTKFGDTADDNHNFTGSVYIDGSLTVDSITGSIDFNNLTNAPTLVSGSSQISYTGITDVPGGIVSGSSQVVDLGFTTTSSFESFTSSYTTHSSSFDSRIDAITGSLNSYTSSTDSHLTTLDNFTSSVVLTNQTSSMTVLSASYALTAAFALNAGAGGSGGSSGGGFAELNQTTPSTSWTFQHNLGQKFPIFQIFDSNDEVIIPSQIIAVSSDSATITFPSAQTGRAIASLGTGPGGMTQEFSAATTWSLSHNMGTDYPIVTVYDNNRKIIFPQEIKSIDGDNIEVYFSVPVAGHLNVAKGGHIISGSIDLTNINLTGSNIISGSSQISNLGYATTGSNTFNGNQTINGCLTINNAKICATGTTISTNTEIFNLSSFDGAFFDYVVKDGSNMRAGSIMSAWDGTNSTYNETTTIDLGNTNAVGFNVSGTGRLNATISSGTWTVEVLYRALGGSSVTPTPTPTSTSTTNPTPTPTATPTATPTVTSSSGTNFLISSGSTAPDYCSGLFGTYQTVYGNASDWLAITRFYTNSSMTTPFNGYDKYYGNSTADYGTTLQIDTQGYVIGNYAC